MKRFYKAKRYSDIHGRLQKGGRRGTENPALLKHVQRKFIAEVRKLGIEGTDHQVMREFRQMVRHNEKL